jgi:hypothetical protein
MLDRTAACFGLKPQRLSADSAYGSAQILAWMVEEKNIAPHVPVWDKGERTDGTFSRSDFIFDAVSNTYTCPRRQNSAAVPPAVYHPADRRHKGQNEALPSPSIRL